MSEDYGSHKEFMSWVTKDSNSRELEIEQILKQAFKEKIVVKTSEFISFSDMSAEELARAIEKFPTILKPLINVCNVATRAIERDLNIKNLDSYNPKINHESARIISGYIKPFLPPIVSIDALVRLDKVSFIDKEIRKHKGQWEKNIVAALNKFSKMVFKKRKFIAGNQKFELDAAYPGSGNIIIGIDIKRIEARRDIHKRCDEIINKSIKLKTKYPKSKFAAVIYYPFIDEHINVKERLNSKTIDSIVFASESTDSIENAVKLLLSKVGL